MCNLLNTKFSNKLERAQEIAKQVYTENRDLKLIPEVLQKYIISCGFTGREKIKCAEIEWRDVSLKLKENGLWKPMVLKQYNFVPEPNRVTYMKNENFQLLPIEAIDSYLDGKGKMEVKMLYLLPIANSTGKEMDQAELVTILAETIFIPLYALQHYIKWEEIDDFIIKGTITDRGTSASGIFYFNQKAEIVRFETSERYFTNSDGNCEKTKWTILVGDYMDQNGHLFPSSFAAVWNRPSGDFEYFKGKIKSIKIDGKSAIISNMH